jgi:hypothetical protein
MGAEPEVLTGFSRATSGFSARVLYQPLLGCRVLDVTSFDIATGSIDASRIKSGAGSASCPSANADGRMFDTLRNKVDRKFSQEVVAARQLEGDQR